MTTMIDFHAVMIGEDGMEFGAGVRAKDRTEAAVKLMDMYPESRIDQLESPEDTAKRERAMHAHIARGGDWDDEGRPIFHYPDYDDDDDEEYSG